MLCSVNVSVVPGAAVAVVVGAGGVGGSPTETRSSGNASSFGNLIAVGGGYGMTFGETGGNGGSGGGLSHGSLDSPGTGIAGQGFPGGGKGYDSHGGIFTASGGGGAGGVGAVGTPSTGGAGGSGASCPAVTGATLYAGGGGGSSQGGPPGGAGGAGGGGAGASVVSGPPPPGGNGTEGTGGGGGGAVTGSTGGPPSKGGNGGSGVVIIKWCAAPPGSYCPSYLTDAFVSCPAGTFATSSNSLFCSVCPPGHYCPSGSTKWNDKNCGASTYEGSHK